MPNNTFTHDFATVIEKYIVRVQERLDDLERRVDELEKENKRFCSQLGSEAELMIHKVANGQESDDLISIDELLQKIHRHS